MWLPLHPSVNPSTGVRHWNRRAGRQHTLFDFQISASKRLSTLSYASTCRTHRTFFCSAGTKNYDYQSKKTVVLKAPQARLSHVQQHMTLQTSRLPLIEWFLSHTGRGYLSRVESRAKVLHFSTLKMFLKWGDLLLNPGPKLHRGPPGPPGWEVRHFEVLTHVRLLHTLPNFPCLRV